MMTRTKHRALAVAAALAVALALLLLGLPAAPRALAAESLSVNLATVTGPATGVGEGFLYGISQDGTQPADEYLQPLGVNAFRGGGWVESGAWVRDGYTYGANTQTNVATIIAQAKRLTQAPYHVQYQVLLSDVWGANGGQPSNSVYPCTNGNCSSWITFIDDVVGALQASGLKFSYDIWNEPDISDFWPGGATDTTQYFAMWDSAYKEIRKDAPNATIVGPDFAYPPTQNQSEWQGFLSHVEGAGTVPDEITNHDEGDGDDPVVISQAINADQTAAGISPLRPLSANEYQPADKQTAGVTAWYLARFAQSGYTNAMRGNWQCCLTPNLTGVLTQSGSSYVPNGNWWVMRAYADMTGSYVSTSGEVGTTAISAAEDSSKQRAVAIVGDENGYTGAASTTFSGFSSVPWLTSGGNVNVVVERIPDSYPLSSPQVVLDQTMSTSSGSITVPFTFHASHDAFAIYLAPTATVSPGYHRLVIGNDGLCTDVYGDVSTAGAAIDQWTCNGQANQEFQFVPVSGGYGELQAGNSGDDAAVAGASTTAGVPDIIQQAPNGAAASLWLPIRQSDGSWEFKNQNSGLCLDVYHAVSTAGQQLDQWSCKNAPGTNQDFTAAS
jgi:hypothetical protein